MASVSIKTKKIDDFILIPRKEYKEFLDFKKNFKGKLSEIKDTNTAIEVYLKEKKQKKLKMLRSLTDLN